MIRLATPYDVKAIAEFWFRFMHMNVKQLRFNMAGFVTVLDKTIPSAKHFCAVDIDDDGEVIGAVIATVDHFDWADKLYCQIELLQGVHADALYEAFESWVASRKAILLVGYSCLISTQTDIILCNRGFVSTNSMLVKYRY